MALTTDLDIHKDATALLDLAVDVQAHIPRVFRASLGARIADECVKLLVLIGRANAARLPSDRVRHIEMMLECVDVVTYLLRAAHDHRSHLIDHKVWGRGMQLTTTIGRKAGGWAKSARAGNVRTSAAPAA